MEKTMNTDNFQFMTRDEYLSYRAWWKDQYIRLGANIREMKNALRRASRGAHEARLTYERLKEQVEVMKDNLVAAGLAADKLDIVDVIDGPVHRMEHYVADMAKGADRLQSTRMLMSNDARNMMDDLDQAKQNARISKMIQDELEGTNRPGRNSRT